MHPSFILLEFNLYEVYELLCALDTTKSSGDDDISAHMLKETALSITPVVTQLFNIHQFTHLPPVMIGKVMSTISVLGLMVI